MVEYLPPAGRIALAHHGRIEGCKPVGRKEYVADPDGGRPAGVMSQKSQCSLPGPVQGLPWAGSVSVALKVFWFLGCLLAFWGSSSFLLSLSFYSFLYPPTLSLSLILYLHFLGLRLARADKVRPEGGLGIQSMSVTRPFGGECSPLEPLSWRGPFRGPRDKYLFQQGN